MPFKPGNPGRPVNWRRKETQRFQEMLLQKGYDPCEAILMIHYIALDAFKENEMDRMQALKIAGDMAKEIASYVMPKLKQIEITSESKFDGMTRAEKIQSIKQLLVTLEEEEEQALKQIEGKEGVE